MNHITIIFIIGMFVSVLLNIFLYFQLKRYQMKNNSYKAKWQDVMGLHNPLNIILWIILIFLVLMMILALLGVIGNMSS